MYLIEAESHSRRFVSGVFLRESDALNFHASIADEHRAKHTIIPVEAIYPLYLVEYWSGGSNRILTAALPDVISKIENIHRQSDDGVYFNVYRVDGDFRPNKPGYNEMGALPHCHVDNEYLVRFQRAGVVSDPVRI